MAGYKDTQEYKMYLNCGVRLPDEFLPLAQHNSNGEVIIAPGELYCRFDAGLGMLCATSKQFYSESTLFNHYRHVHKAEVEKRECGGINGELDANLRPGKNPILVVFPPVPGIAAFAKQYWSAQLAILTDPLAHANLGLTLKTLRRHQPGFPVAEDQDDETDETDGDERNETDDDEMNETDNDEIDETTDDDDDDNDDNDEQLPSDSRTLPQFPSSVASIIGSVSVSANMDQHDEDEDDEEEEDDNNNDNDNDEVDDISVDCRPEKLSSKCFQDYSPEERQVRLGSPALMDLPYRTNGLIFIAEMKRMTVLHASTTFSAPYGRASLFEFFEGVPSRAAREPNLVILAPLAEWLHLPASNSNIFQHLFIADASHFFEIEPSLEWPRLSSLELTSKLLTPAEDSTKIETMLRAAAAAARKMPQLKTMEIWNGRKGLAGLFKYKVDGDTRQAEISWRGTWKLRIGPSVVGVWEDVVPQRDNWRLKVLAAEFVDEAAIKSHGDAIIHLKLSGQVIWPISLQQIQMEQKALEGVQTA
ncbi:hypothetical protein HJFPF1_04741 [Paramyrothecium foliicola]|nr:hypothetical protein HJFPF1_04741 [Paramyrothecium foliicola]